MEPAIIDWKTIDSVFVIDQVFENINAPQWVDFLASSNDSQYDDVSWFCRSDCKHPTKPEDFLQTTPKLLRSVSVSKLISDWTPRKQMNLKRQGKVNEEDNENRNPNLSTPNHNYDNHGYKGVIKSSDEKGDDFSEIMLESSDEKPRSLNATQSARDLFGGKDIFGKITELCNELKKMAATSKAKDREDNEEDERLENLKVVNAKQVLGPKEMNERAKERKPFLEVKVDALEKSNGKGKLKRNKMRDEDAENIPMCLDMNKIKREEKVPSTRVNPPTPQGFSATGDPLQSTPSKGPKSRLVKRDGFQEAHPKNTLREMLGEKEESENATLVAGAKEGRSLDVLWFFKPCTLSRTHSVF